MIRSSAPEDTVARYGWRTLLLIGIWVLLTLAVVWGLLRLEIAEAQREVQLEAEFFHKAMVEKAILNDAAIDGLTAALRLCPRRDTNAARNYAKAVLARYPHVHLIGAATRIEHGDREGFESALRAQGLAREISWFECEDKRQWERVPDRPVYWPIQMAEPELEATWGLLGVDLGYIPIFRDTLQRSFGSDRPVTSGAFELVEDGDARAFGLLRPVCDAVEGPCDSGNPESTPRFVVILLVLAEEMVNCRGAAVKGFECKAWLDDASLPPEDGVLVSAEPAAGPALLDRILFPRAYYRGASDTSSQPLVLELGRQLGRSEVNLAPMLALLFVSAIGLAVVLHYLRHRESSERARASAYRALTEERASLELRVRERTRMLRRLNETLERENEARKTAEQAVRQKSEQLRLLTRRLMAAQERERRNLVRELHDDVGQALTAIRTHASMIRSRHSAKDDICPRSAQTIMDLSGQLYDSIHRIMRKLRPRALDDLGLAVALQNCIDGAGLEAAGIAVHVRIDKGLERLDETAAIAVYRLLQEALTNVVRHANAGNVWIRVACKKRPKASDLNGHEVLEVSIEDDGRGLPEGGIPVQRLGLLGIEERVHSVGGDLVIGNRVSGGMFLRAVIPITKGENDG